jgi:hypothetical protein
VRPAFFRDLTQSRMVFPYRRFGTTSLSRLQGSNSPIPLKLHALEDGTIRCPETSVAKCHFALRKTPEDHRSHFHRGGSRESRIKLRSAVPGAFAVAILLVHMTNLVPRFAEVILPLQTFVHWLKHFQQRGIPGPSIRPVHNIAKSYY